MKKLRKRIISMLLVVVLAVSLLPAGAFAVYDPGDLDPIEDGDGNSWFPLGENSGLEYAYYGRTYIEDGALVTEAEIVIRIDSDYEGSPTHKIPDYENETDRPWVPKDTGVYLRVYIEDGVKGIGSNAFSNMQYTSEFVIEDPIDLEYIGENAFSGGGMNGGATFTTGLPNETTEGSLDLSNVETIGVNAFNGCSKLKKVTLDNDLNAIESGKTTPHKIADGAFAGTGLTEITIPEEVTAIGDSAFANPSGDGFTTLVIPENVTAIGESAFSGHGLLDTVEIYAGQNVAITVGDDAFANCGTEAGTNITGYTDDDLKDWNFETGELPEGTGTQFNNVRPLFLFQHDKNTTANLSALEGKSPSDGVSAMYLNSDSTAADCTTPGYNGYVFYKEGHVGDDAYKYNYVELLPALGHQYDTGGVEVDEDMKEAGEDYFNPQDPENTYIEEPTCEQPERWALHCTRDGCGYVHHINVTDGKPALEHNYKVTEITTDNGTTTITYVCKNDEQHDGEEAQTVKYAATNGSIRVLTTDTLAQVMTRLTQFQKIDSEIPPLGGTLSWNFDSMSVESDASTMYEAGYREETPNSVLHLIFDPDDNSRYFPTTGTDDNDDNEKLTIPVTVEKDVLDLSGVSFAPTTQFSGLPQSEVTLNSNVTISGAVLDNEKKAVFYNEDGTPYGTAGEQPENTSNNIGKYRVRLYFKYQNEGMYRLPISEEDQYFNSQGYTCEEIPDGSGFWIECNYEIREQDINGAAVTDYNITFDTLSHHAFEVYGVPNDASANITVSFVGSDDAANQEGTLSVGSNGSYWGPEIVNAGTYTYTITISGYGDTKTLSATTVISPREIPAPTGIDGNYFPGQTHTGVIYGGTEPINNEDVTFYTFTVGEESDTGMTFDEAGNATAINAGDYVVTAELTYPHSTYWAGNENDNTNKNIEWSISPIGVPVPTANTDLVYNNKLKTGITQSGNFTLEWSADNSGNGTGLYKYGENHETAYTVTNGRATDGGTYTATATLDPSGNYVWADKTTDDKEIEWTISPMPVNVADYVTVDADTVPYDGDVYEDSNVEVDASNADGQIFESVFDSYTLTYSTEKPTNAGRYTVRVTFTDYNTDNFSLDYGGFTPASFNITPVMLNMTFDKEEQKAVFTESGTALQKVSVTGGESLAPQPGKDYTIIYSYRYKADANAEWTEEDVWTPISDPDTQVFEDTGFYEIKAEMSGVSGVENYTAPPASYTLTITKSSQSITLTPDNYDRWTAAEGDTPKYTITYGDAETFTVTGKPALDDAQISYEVTEGGGVITADGAEMTILKPGDATVTVTAEATDNAEEESVTYTVKVEKADPGLSLNAGALDLRYDGAELEKGDIEDAVEFDAPEYADNLPSSTGWDFAFYTYNEDTADSDKTALESGNTDGMNETNAAATGKYWLLVTYTEDDYYTVDRAAAVIEIKDAAMNIDIDGYSGTYDGEPHDAASSVKITGINNADITKDCTVYFIKKIDDTPPESDDERWNDALTVTNVSDSGDYWYKVEAPNYETVVGQIPITVTISRAVLKIEPAVDKPSKSYDGTTAVYGSVTGTVTGVNDEVITAEAITSSYDIKDVGATEITITYRLTAREGVLDNYTYGDAELSEGCEVEVAYTDGVGITPREITVSGVNAESRQYDGTTSIELTGSPTTEDKVFLGDQLNGDVSLELTGADGSVSEDDKNYKDGTSVDVDISPNAVNVSGNCSGNYTITDVEDTQVIITRRDVTLSFTGSMEHTYDGTLPADVYEAEVTSGLIGSDIHAGDIKYTFFSDPGGNDTIDEPAGVGTYYVQASISAAGNYAGATTGITKLVISPATDALTVTAESYSDPEGDDIKTYDGKEHAAGAITVTGSGTVLTPDDYVIYYSLDGEATTDDQTTMPNLKDAGDYTIHYLVVTDNFGEKSDSFEVKIAPAELTLSSTVTQNKPYDANDSAGVTEPEVYGAQTSETISVTATAAYNTPDAGSEKTITVTYKVFFGEGVKKTNYTYAGEGEMSDDPSSGWTVTEETPGSISKADVTVKISNQSAVYDGKQPEVGSVKGTNWSVTSGTVFKDDNLQIKLSIPENSADANTDGYAITGEAGNTNYNVTFNDDAKFVVDYRPINVTIKYYTTYYGEARPGQDKLLELETFSDGSGLVGGDELYLMGKIGWGSVSKTANSGTYTVTGTDGVVDNYDVHFISTDNNYVINRRPITVNIISKSIEYGQSIEALTNINRKDGTSNLIADEDDDYTVELRGIHSSLPPVVNNDKLNIMLSVDAVDYSNIGDYAVTGLATGEKASNYEIVWNGEYGDETSGKLTIERAVLVISFTEGSNGDIVLKPYSSTYRNPLIFTNSSTGGRITNPTILKTLEEGVVYTYDDASPENFVSAIDQDGTLHLTTAPGQVVVTAQVLKLPDNCNYTTSAPVSYTLGMSQIGASLSVNFERPTLIYNSTEQVLLGKATVRDGNGNLLTEGKDFDIEYRLTVRDGEPVTDDTWSNEVPKGLDAGNYTVQYRIVGNPAYTPVETPINVTIEQAELEGFENSSTLSKQYSDGLVITQDDNAFRFEITDTGGSILDMTEDFKGTVIFSTTHPDIAEVTSGENGQYSIKMLNQTSTSGITIRAAVSGDDNYVSATYEYQLIVSENNIIADVSGAGTFTYDGNEHYLTIKTENLDEGQYYIVYGVEDNDGEWSYNTTENPTFTNVGTYTIHYEIRPEDGYEGYAPAPGSAEIEITPKDINTETVPGTADVTAGGVAETYTYMGGQSIEPPVTVYDSVIDRELVKGTDYELDYDNNTEVSVDDEYATITVTGKGNYEGELKQVLSFRIVSVQSSYMWAELTENYGILDSTDGSTSTAVEVFHGSDEKLDPDGGSDFFEITVTGTDLKGGEITVSEEDINNATGEITFRTPGTYSITVEVSGNHSGEFDLSYALLPMQSENGFELSAGSTSGAQVITYGESVTDLITVEINDQPLSEVNGDYTLSYVYTPFVGDPAGSQDYNNELAGKPAAGVYEITATGGAAYHGVTGSFVCLVQQRDIADIDDENVTISSVGEYDGHEKKPDVELSFDGEYVSITTEPYNNINAGTAQVVSTADAGSNNFTGTRVDTFEIAKADISNVDRFTVGEIDEQDYTGFPVVPEVTITDSARPEGEKTLIYGQDYTTKAANDGSPSTEAKAVITGTGNYCDTREVTFTITSEPTPDPDANFDLIVEPREWTWGSAPDDLRISVTFEEGKELAPEHYRLTIDGTGYTIESAAAFLKNAEPGSYTVEADGTGAYAPSSDSETVNVKKIQPVLNIEATPTSLTGSGSITLTLSGSGLPDDTVLSHLLTFYAQNGTKLDLSSAEWTANADGSLTAELRLPNANETYTFTLSFPGDVHHESADDTATVVTARRTSGGGGGGGSTAYTITAEAEEGGIISPDGETAVVRGDDQSFAIRADSGWHIEDVLVDGKSVGAVSSYTFENVTRDHTITAVFAEGQVIADPDETGVSDWLNTSDHMAYMQGYPDGTFGPQKNMTRAEAAQMFYNLLLDKDVRITAEFTDVDDGAWYAEAVNALASLGMINGVGDSRFEPERSITRAEFTAIAMRFAELDTDGENIFSDVGEDDWFYDVVVGSIKYGWINGYSDGTFRPDETITRAEVATITNRMLGRAADEDYVDGRSDALRSFTDLSDRHWAYYNVMEATNEHEYEKEDGVETWTRLG